MKKFDRFILGFSIGMIAPIVTFLIVYLTKYTDISLSVYVQSIINQNIITKLISLSVLPNLIIFFGFLNTNRFKSTQGIIAATFIVAFLMLLIKLVV